MKRSFGTVSIFPKLPGSTRHSGKRFFESQILAAGLRLVEPPSKNGVDYLIYTGNSSNGKGVAYPVKVKTSIHEVFALHKRDSRIPRLLVAYVWHANEPERSSVYALTFEEALRIVESKPYIVSKAWNEDGGYSVTHAGAELKEMLKTYRMSPERWTQRLQSL